MRISERFCYGMEAAGESLQVVWRHPRLLWFPAFSGVLLLGLVASFVPVTELHRSTRSLSPVVVGGVYLASYFVMTFFNVALVAGVRAVFRDEPLSLAACLRQAWRRVGAIAAWALFAATVGVLLRWLEEASEWGGQLVAGMLGTTFSIVGYFVTPVLAYEQVGPLQALKRSLAIVRGGWGESLAAHVTFGAVGMVAGLSAALIGFGVGQSSAAAGWLVGGSLFGVVQLLLAAAAGVYTTATYERLSGHTHTELDRLAASAPHPRT